MNKGDLIKVFWDLYKAETTGVVVSTAYDEEKFDSKQIVINMPKLPQKTVGMNDGVKDKSGSIGIEVYAKTFKDCVKLDDEVQQITQDNKSTFPVQNLEVGESDIATIEKTAGTIKMSTIPFSFIKWE